MAAAQPELSYRLIELIGGEIRVLQRQRRHSHETVRILRDRGRDLFVLHGDHVAGERAFGRVPPRVDVDGLNVDALFVHVLQALRRAGTECNRAREIVLGGRGQWSVFHDLPDFGHEAMGVDVDDGDAAAADRGSAPGRRCLRGISKTATADEHAGRRAGETSDEVSTIRHHASFVQ